MNESGADSRIWNVKVVKTNLLKFYDKWNFSSKIKDSYPTMIKEKFFNMMFECLWTSHGWAEKKTIRIFVYSLVLLKEVVLTLECSTLSI